MITPIKYDKNDRKRYKKYFIITGVVALVGRTLSLISFIMPKLFQIVLLFSPITTITSILFVLFLLFYLNSIVYLNRLKKNHFTLPEDKRDYKYDLSLLPRDEQVENRYSKDSIIAAIISLIFYLIIMFIMAKYIGKWNQINEDVSLFFIPSLIFLFFPFMSIYFFRQHNPQKYRDNVDVFDGRKNRTDIMSALELLVISLLISIGISIATDQASRFFHLCRYDSIEKSMEIFKKKASMTISSNDLKDGVWNPDIFSIDGGAGLSPHLYFDPVEGADHYVIYMVDETGGHYGTWLATEIQENELFTGDNLTIHADDPNYRYTGSYIYPPDKSPILVSVYVFALRDETLNDVSTLFSEYSSCWPLEPNELYVDYLSLICNGKISFMFSDRRYGNVISYGYITGTYYPK